MDLRALFPGWVDLDELRDRQNGDDLASPERVERADSSRPLELGRGGGSSSGSGRLRGRPPAGAALFRNFIAQDLQRLQEEEEEERKEDEASQGAQLPGAKRAAHARKVRLANLRLQAPEPAPEPDSSGRTQDPVLSTQQKHLQARADTLSCVTDLQRQLVSVAELNSANLALQQPAALGEEGERQETTVAALLTRSLPVASAAAAGAMLQRKRGAMRTLPVYAASALVNAASVHVLSLVNWLHRCQEAGTHRLVAVVKKRRYDETPLRVAVDVSGERVSGQTTAKVMQSELSVTLLVQDLSRRGSHDFATFHVNLPTWLQALEKTTADITKASQDSLQQALLPELERWSHLFDTSVSLSNTDRFTGNFRAEKAMARDAPGWLSNHYGCDVHAAARVVKHQLLPVDGHISGMIAAALAMSEAGSCRVFRGCLESVIADRLVVVVEPPQEELMRRTIAVLDLFLKPDAQGSQPYRKERHHQVQKQRAIILFFLNGNINDAARVEHYTQAWDLDKSKVLRAMTKFLVPALIPHKPPLLSRKSWTGADNVFSYFGLLTSCHNLFLPAIQLFTQVQSKPDPVLPFASEPGQSALPAGVSGAPNALEDVLPSVGQPGPEHHDDAKDDVDWPSSLTGDLDWSAVNRCMRARLARWADYCPGPTLVTMKLATLPAFRLLHRLLWQGSAGFERRQRRKFQRSGSRRYVVQEAARMTLLDDFFNDTWTGFQTRSSAIAEDAMPHELQVLHFCMLSAAACAAEFLIGMPWRSYPVKLFGMLDGRRECMTDPDCVLDPLSKGLLKQFAPVDSPAFSAVLETVASNFTLDIAAVEAKHASTRRLLHVRHVQTHLPDLAAIGAAWTCRRNVIDLQETCCKTKQEPKKAAEPKQVPCTKHGRGPKDERRGGAWRAFVHESVAGHQFGALKIKALAHRYKELPAEERARLQQAGKIATMRGTLGYEAFPATSSQLQSTESAERSLAVANPADQESAVQSHILAARSVSKQERQEYLANLAAEEEALDGFQFGEQSAQLHPRVLSVAPTMLSSYRPFPAPVPSVQLHLPAEQVAQA